MLYSKSLKQCNDVPLTSTNTAIILKQISQNFTTTPTFFTTSLNTGFSITTFTTATNSCFTTTNTCVEVPASLVDQIHKHNDNYDNEDDK